MSRISPLNRGEKVRFRGTILKDMHYSKLKFAIIATATLLKRTQLKRRVLLVARSGCRFQAF